MATFRVSHSNGQWVVKKSGSVVSRAANKRQAKQQMDRRARDGDTKIIERKDGSVMSKREEREPDQINPMQSETERSGGMFGSFF